MANIKTAYGTQAQAITCTLASLASAAARESTVIDNNTNLYTDALVEIGVKLSTGTPAGQKGTNVYVYGTVDAATPVYPDAVTGTDAAITLNAPTNLKLLGTIQTPAASTTYKGGPWSVAQAFGGTMPQKWGIVIENQSGANAYTAVEGDHTKIYQGVYLTSV